MKLKYTYEIEINKPVGFVVELFRDRHQLPNWQRGLIRSELLPEVDGQATYKLTFTLGRRKMHITETIVRDDLPAYYESVYKMKGAQHTLKTSFYSCNADTTKWIYDVEFRFKGIMNIIARFMKSGFEQQSRILMKNFKSFAERQ